MKKKNLKRKNIKTLLVLEIGKSTEMERFSTGVRGSTQIHVRITGKGWEIDKRVCPGSWETKAKIFFGTDNRGKR